MMIPILIYPGVKHSVSLLSCTVMHAWVNEDGLFHEKCSNFPSLLLTDKIYRGETEKVGGKRIFISGEYIKDLT